MMNAKEKFIAYNTIQIKEITRILRVWMQTLLSPAITITLYFIIFGKFIGSQIQHVDGFSYMQYITPGLIIMPTITAAFVNTVSSFFSAKFMKSIEEMLVSPMPNYVILLGHVAGGVFRAIIIGGIVTIIALFFTQIHVQHIFIAIITVVLSSILFSLAGFINGIFARNFDDISFIPTFVLTPLTYLGGVFYSIKALPKFWYHVSLFNPILHIVNAFRFSILGISDVNIFIAFAIIISFIIVLFAVNLYLLNKGIGIRD